MAKGGKVTPKTIATAREDKTALVIDLLSKHKDQVLKFYSLTKFLFT